MVDDGPGELSRHGVPGSSIRRLDADSETQAHELGRFALHELYADVRKRLGRAFSIDIRTVRPAADDEIELCRWHYEMVAHERELGNG